MPITVCFEQRHLLKYIKTANETNSSSSINASELDMQK